MTQQQSVDDVYDLAGFGIDKCRMAVNDDVLIPAWK